MIFLLCLQLKHSGRFLPQDKTYDWSKFKAFSDDKNKCGTTLYVILKNRKNYWKKVFKQNFRNLSSGRSLEHGIDCKCYREGDITRDGKR